MVDSIAATAPLPTVNTAALQFAETAALLDTTSGNTIDSNGFLIPLLTPAVQAAIEANATDNNADIGTEGLLNIDTPTLSLFNEVSNDPENAEITGHLNAQQLQDIALLQQDALMLDEAVATNSSIPLVENGTTLDLSLEAQEIIAANSNVAPTPGSNTLTLTEAQLAQLNQILTPYLNEPLTTPVLLQIQEQLAANQINPLAMSLSTLFLMQNYIAGLQPAVMTTLAKDVENNEDTAVVTAVSSVDGAAVEDSAILS